MSAAPNGNENSPLIPKEPDEPHSTPGRVTSTATNSSDSNSALSRQQRVLNAVCILVTELCERMTFYGASANLVLFSKNVLKLQSPWPSTITLLFTGTCFLSPLLGGWLADSYLGQYNTIYGSSLLYFVGVVLLATVSTSDNLLKSIFNASGRVVFFILALVLIAFSAGGIKANVSPFGADQLKQDGPRALQTFFNYFYWFINIGAFLAFTVVVAVQQKDIFSGYAIVVGSMLLGIIVFLTCRNRYLVKPPGLEFAYSQAPEYLKGVIMALFLSASGIGSYIANFVVAIVSSDWYPEKDPNQGHMEYFFFMMAGLMTLNFLLFLFIASSYKYKESSSQSEETEEDQDAHELTISVSSVHG